MRVRFLASYRDYPAGDIAQLDQGVGDALLAQGIVEHAPLTEDEIVAFANAPQPGDDKLAPEERAKRTQQLLVVLRSIN